MRYKAYIWDYDGTLIDSYPHIIESFRLTMEEAGTPVDPAEAARYFYDNFGVPRKKYGVPADVWEIFRSRHDAFSLRPIPEPFPDIPAVLRAIKENGGINLLYTHSDAHAWKGLTLYGLDKYFAGRVDAFGLQRCLDALFQMQPEGQAADVVPDLKGNGNVVLHA